MDIYKQEVERIWRVQAKSLSNKTPAKLTAEDEYRYEQRERAGSAPAQTPSYSMGTPNDPYSKLSPGQLKQGLDPFAGKYLRIKREVRSSLSTLSRC